LDLGGGTILLLFLPLEIYLTTIYCVATLGQTLSWVLKYSNKQIFLFQNPPCQLVKKENKQKITI
jgi:hypothetical protein